jgi:hypothetical protein
MMSLNLGAFDLAALPLHEPENRQDQISGKAEARLRAMNVMGFPNLVGSGCKMNGCF